MRTPQARVSRSTVSMENPKALKADINELLCEISPIVYYVLAALWLFHPTALSPDVFLGLVVQHQKKTPLEDHTAVFE